MEERQTTNHKPQTPLVGIIMGSDSDLTIMQSAADILQMPNGVPVATIALNAAKNAGILAAQIIGAFDNVVAEKIASYKMQMNEEVISKVEKLKEGGWTNQFD